MEISENNSVLSVNNSFHKRSNTINEKKSKNESTVKETEWIQAQLLSENPKICENAVNVLISTCDAGFALNCFIATIPRLPAGTYEIVADGIFRLLSQDLAKPGYKCSFDIQRRPHPLLLLIDDSSEKMLFLSLRIVGILRNGYKIVRSNAIEFLRPVLMMLLCNEKISGESREIWRNVLHDETIVREVLTMRRTTTVAAALLFNSMILESLEESGEPIHSLLLLLASTKRLAALSMDPSGNFRELQRHYETVTDASNIVLFVLAEILQITSIVHIPQLLDVLEILILKKKLGHPLILHMVLDGLIQVLAYPSFAKGKVAKAERLVNFIRNDASGSDVQTMNFSSNFLNLNPDLTNARDLSIMLETQADFPFKAITTEAEKFFWTRNQLVLRSFFHSHATEFDKWSIVLHNLIEISKADDGMKSSLVMPLLSKLSSSTDPRMKLAILQNMIQLGATAEVFSTIKAISTGLDRSMAINLHLRMWKMEPRTYPFLHKFLVEKSSKDAKDFGLEIVRASAIREICALRPHHGSDLVSIISEILNDSLDLKDGEVPAALAIDAIRNLCENHIINIVSTWKAISLKTRYEKRARVVKSLCKFYAIVPTLKRNKPEHENLVKEILERMWSLIQSSDKNGIECAVDALKCWKYDAMTLDSIPEVYRDGFALPEALDGKEVSILDMEVPGECFVQLLTKVYPAGLKATGGLLIHYIGCEIDEFKSGHYQVKDGQPEPLNYKNLHKQSILKAVAQFVFQQATSKKADKLVEEALVVEALRILAHKYRRPLPPLNWCFLHDMLHKSEKIKAQCLRIAAKQSVISGTAKRLVENFLLNLDGDDAADVETSLDVLVDLCNGVAPDVMRSFCEFVFKLARSGFEEKMTKCLRQEKEVTNRENLAMLLAAYIATNSPTTDFIKLIPSKVLDMISFQLDQRTKIRFRCEILKANANVENPIGWLSELLTEQLMAGDHREHFLQSFLCLLIESDAFPKRKWITDFIILVQNRMVEKDLEEDKIKFLLDVFAISVVASSGYFKVKSCHEEILIKRFEMLPQSVELVSRQTAFNDEMGKIFEFLLHIINRDGVSAEIREAFTIAIVITKEHSYFKKPTVWQRFLMVQVV